MASLSRRELCIGLGAMVGGNGLAQTAIAQEEDACTPLQAEIADLEAELDELQELTEHLPEENAALYRDIIGAFAEAQTPTYPSGVREEAFAVGDAVRESVVILDVEGEVSVGTGTAWCVDEGYLLTNAHNVDRSRGGHTTLQVVSYDGTSYDASVVDIEEDQRPDVALLETDFPGAPLPVGSAETLAEGDHMVQVGHPGDFGEFVITLGEFIAIQDTNTLTATVPGVEGVSGSPIVNMDGEVVAMTYGGQSDNEPPREPGPLEPQTSFFLIKENTMAVPIETAIETMESWR